MRLTVAIVSILLCTILLPGITTAQSEQIHVHLVSISTNYQTNSHPVHGHPQYEFSFSFEVLNEASHEQELDHWANMLYSNCKDPVPIRTNGSFETLHPQGTGATCSAPPKYFDPGLTRIDGKTAAISIENGSSHLPDGFYWLELSSDNGQGSIGNITVSDGEINMDLPPTPTSWITTTNIYNNTELTGLPVKGWIILTIFVIPIILRKTSISKLFQ